MDVLENVAKTIVLTGLIVGMAYGTEFFIAWYSRNPVEMESFRWRAVGTTLGSGFMVLCNVLIPCSSLPPGAGEHFLALRDFAGRELRHVVGAIRHHRRRGRP